MEIKMLISYSLPALTLSLEKVGANLLLINKDASIHKLLFLFLACPSHMGLLSSSLMAQDMELVEGGTVTFTCVSFYHSSHCVIRITILLQMRKLRLREEKFPRLCCSSCKATIRTLSPLLAITRSGVEMTRPDSWQLSVFLPL